MGTAEAPIAVLAHVHANRWALDAVVADARAAGAARFADLGDCVAGALDPRGTDRSAARPNRGCG
jgi:hypothetical protein